MTATEEFWSTLVLGIVAGLISSRLYDLLKSWSRGKKSFLNQAMTKEYIKFEGQIPHSTTASTALNKLSKTFDGEESTTTGQKVDGQSKKKFIDSKLLAGIGYAILIAAIVLAAYTVHSYNRPEQKSANPIPKSDSPKTLPDSTGIDSTGKAGRK